MEALRASCDQASCAVLDFGPPGARSAWPLARGRLAALESTSGLIAWWSGVRQTDGGPNQTSNLLPRHLHRFMHEIRSMRRGIGGRSCGLYRLPKSLYLALQWRLQ